MSYTTTALEIPASQIVAGDTTYDLDGVAKVVTTARSFGTVDGVDYIAVNFTRSRKANTGRLAFKSTDIVRVWR